MIVCVDLDKTLAYYKSENGISTVGAPIGSMVDNVRRWTKAGHDYVIFTARVSRDAHTIDEVRFQKDLIYRWVLDNGLPIPILITAEKQPGFEVFIDDKACHCVPNEGLITDLPPELL